MSCAPDHQTKTNLKPSIDAMAPSPTEAVAAGNAVLSVPVNGGSIDYKVTSLLTEHFGFPPLALIDDVINAVNELLYKCTQAMEVYLREMREKSDDTLSEEEIAVGTGKLETLLESQVDKNFDKFELYALRNIFTLPQDLVEEGWVRLKHHEGIDFQSHSRTKKHDNDIAIAQLVNKIKLELHVRKILKLQISRAQKVIKMLRMFQKSLVYLGKQAATDEDQLLSEKAREAIRSLSPIDETLYFLLHQVEELVTQTQKISSKINGGTTLELRFPTPSMRDIYIDAKLKRILERIGLVDDTHEKTDSKTVTKDLAAVKDIADGLQGV